METVNAERNFMWTQKNQKRYLSENKRIYSTKYKSFRSGPSNLHRNLGRSHEVPTDTCEQHKHKFPFPRFIALPAQFHWSSSLVPLIPTRPTPGPHHTPPILPSALFRPFLHKINSSSPHILRIPIYVPHYYGLPLIKRIASLLFFTFRAHFLLSLIFHE